MKWRYQAPSLLLILALVVLILVHVHLLMTKVHKDHITLIGLVLTLDYSIDMTVVIHLDMTVMMPETITIGLVVMLGIIRIEMIALDTTIIGMADQIAILHSVITVFTIAMTTILHLADNGKVKEEIRAETRVITVPVVMVRIHTINMVLEAKTEVIVKMTTTSSGTIIIKVKLSHMVEMARIQDKLLPISTLSFKLV